MENFNFKLEIIKIKCENGELVEMINKMKFENFKENNKIDEFNFDFKMENFKFRLEMVDLCKEMDGVRYENCELKNVVNEMKVWMRFG